MKRILVIALLASALFMALGATALADGNIYWADATGQDIWRATNAGADQTKLVDEAPTPLGVAVDDTNGYVFWTDYFTKKVMRAELADGANVTEVYTMTSGTPSGIAVDPANEMIYFGDSVDKEIESCSYTGTAGDALSTADSPLDLAIDAASGKLYWIEQTGGVVKRADVNGANEETLAPGDGAYSAKGLTLDLESDLVYYSYIHNTNFTYSLLKVGMDGSGQQSITSLTGKADWLALDAAAGEIYFATGSSKSIRKVNTDGNGEADVMTGLGTTKGIAFLGGVSISVGDPAPVTEGDSGPVQVSFDITLSEASDEQVTVDWATADGTATTAGNDYTAASGTATFAIGMTERTVNVDVLGDVLDEDDETFTVELSNSSGPGIGSAGTCTITDDDAMPTVSVSDGALLEGDGLNGPMTFTATLSAISGRAVTVTYATQDDTATAGSDYTAVGATELGFTPGQTERTFTVTVLGDTTDEYDERIKVDLTSPVNATILDSQGIGTITDNDAPPTVSLSDTTVTEGDSGAIQVPFTATLSAESGKPITLTLSTLDGEATVADGDYAAVVSQTLLVSPGAVTATYAVDVNGDATDEANETFQLRIDQAQNATISSGVATGTITDNDEAPNISISDSSVTEGNSGTVSAVFTVTLSAASGQTVGAVATAVSSTATVDDGDFVAPGNMPLLFPAGVITQFVTVTVNSDLKYETDETFGVDLGSLNNVQADDVNGTGTILNDDTVPEVSVADASVIEGDSGTVNMVFTATLSNASYQTAVASVSLSAASATSDIDYVDTTGSLSFAPGVITDTFAVTVNGDTVAEGNETFTLTLAAPSNCTVADGTATGTIIDDDAEVALLGNGIEISDGDVVAGTADGTDFGQVAVFGTSITHTFVISNPSPAQLMLTGTPVVTVTGTNAGDFVVTAQPTSPVTAWMSTTFDLTFDPSVAGARTATVSFANTDADEDPYNFVVAGTGATPDLYVLKGLDSNNWPPQVGDLITYSVTIRNDGQVALTSVNVSDTLPAGLAFAGPVSLLGATGDLAQSADDLPTVASGFDIGVSGQAIVRLPVTVTGATTWITNTVSVSCNELPEPVSDDHDVARTVRNIAYVDGALGTDSMDYGTAPGVDAYRTIQYALDRTGTTVYVAAGTYYEHLVLQGQSLMGGADATGPDSQVIIDGGGSGTVVELVAPAGYISGLTIQNGDIGILAQSHASESVANNLKSLNYAIQVHFCNILSHNQYGIKNDAFSLLGISTTGDVFDATDNWWGANDGPSGVGSGSGSAVSANVTYDPWLGAGVAASSVGQLPSGDATLDGSDETGIVVSKSGTGTPVLTVARYDGNPQGFVADGMGLYYDVQLSSAEGVDELKVRFYLTSASLAGYFADTIEMLYWDGTEWVLCSNQTLVQGSVVINGQTYAAYVEVLINSTTTPSLSDLTGTEFTTQGAQQVPPANLGMSLTVGPDPFCPGWSLSYVMMLTNTSTITLTNLVVDDVLPEGACCLADDPGSDAAAIYDAGSNSAVWQADDLAPGETLTLRYTVHTFTSLVDGSTLTNTMTISSTELTEAGSVVAGSLVDAGICGTQPTPTPSPTPPVYAVSLPLILQ